MADYRQIHTRMWSDTWFNTLTPAEKLVYIYLCTNERASVCGLYELLLRNVSSATGLSMGRILQAFDLFAGAGKAWYDPQTGVVWVKNMYKFQASSSPKLMARIQADIEAVPECELKDRALRYLIDTVGIPYGRGSDTLLSVSVSGSGSVSLSGSVLEGEGVPGEREAADPQVVPPEGPSLARGGQVWAAYEGNIGALTPLVAESLADDEREYGAEWVCAAIQEAVKSEARNLKYVEAILARWKRDGFGQRGRRSANARGSPRAGRKSAGEVHAMLAGWLQESGG